MNYLCIYTEIIGFWLSYLHNYFDLTIQAFYSVIIISIILYFIFNIEFITIHTRTIYLLFTVIYSMIKLNITFNL